MVFIRLFVLASLLLISSKSFAQENQENVQPTQQPALTVEELKKNFEAMKQQRKSNPKDMNLNFNFAQIAFQLGQFKDAEEAYRQMLDVDPNLGRVKLDLGLIYARTARFKEAKKVFEDVLATNPPEEVKKNINSVLTNIDKALKPDVFSLSASMGINRDSNATSAASTGENTYSNISIPLSSSSTAHRDTQFFVTTSGSHTHKFDIDSDTYGLSHTSTLTFYRTYQDTEHGLDLRLLSAKTGPTLELKKIRTQIGLSGSYSLIELNSEHYMTDPSGDLLIRYAVNDRLLLDTTTTYEYRKFSNSPTVTTYTNKTGNAIQDKVGVTFLMTPTDMLNGNVTWRKEEAASDEFGNTQVGFSAGYTHQFPLGIAANVTGAYKETEYNGVDATITSSVVRQDKERSVSFMLAKKLPKNITLTGGYQYKNVYSNIQNYDYVNHRFSTAVGWTF